MKELTEIRFHDDRIFLKDNHVRSPILPQVAAELNRDVVVQGDCVIDGAIFARNLEIEHGPCRARGAVFTQLELHVNSDARGVLFFEKAVGSSNAVVSLAPACRLHFLSDVTARSVRLRNAYVSGSIFADEVVLEDCVVIGGVFGSSSVELNNCIAGTFNAPVVRASRTNYLLLPSAFTVEAISALPGTQVYNLALADLGALMRRAEPLPNTGKIAMEISREDLKAVLSGDGTQQIVRTYSIAGKVLAADLVDYDRLQNHFLLSCASLGSQLLRTYDLGLDDAGNPVQLTPERVADFFFSVLEGKFDIPEMSGSFDIGATRGEPPVIFTRQAPKVSVAEAQAEHIAADELTSEPPQPNLPEDASPAEPELQTTIASQPASEEAVLEELRCSQCQELIEPGEAFCGNCGLPQ